MNGFTQLHISSAMVESNEHVLQHVHFQNRLIRDIQSGSQMSREICQIFYLSVLKIIVMMLTFRTAEHVFCKIQHRREDKFGLQCQYMYLQQNDKG